MVRLSRFHRVLSSVILVVVLLLVPAAVPPVQAGEVSAEPFADYYWRHQGERTLGRIHSPLVEINGYRMQYFEKGRLEDHRHLTDNPAHAVAYSRLTVDLIATAPDIPVNGLPISYGELAERGTARHTPPPGFVSGTMQTADGVYVSAEPGNPGAGGYMVPFQFWTYINRAHLFPGGWVHDIGLPLTNAFHLLVPADDGSEKRLVVQAFERTVLTLDLEERYEWPVQRLNIGTDAAWVYGTAPSYTPHAAPPAEMLAPAGPRRIEVDLGRQWLYAYEGERLIWDAPVSTGKDGFNTPPGRFAIYAKIPRKTLRGRARGESWNVPDVPSIMFYQGAVAIHGVYWHDRFGTGERLSHGCVGLAPYDAAAVYAWAPHGTPVIVY
jgi:hypothetical protein